MRLCAKLMLGLSCLIAVPAAHAATLIPVVPFPGSTVTNVSGINDSNTIVGYYANADTIEHGYFGTLAGSYTSFDYGGTALGTEPRSINNAGNIVGFAPDAGFNSGPEFFRAADGTVTTFKKSHVVLDGIAQGINKRNVSVGDYITDPETMAQTGYEGRNGRYRADLTLPVDTTRVDGRAITSTGAVAGWYVGTDHVQHGFIQRGEGFQTIDADDSGTTDLEGLNDAGIATGAVLDDSENFHAFTLDTNTDTLTWITVPGAATVQAWGVNKKGLVALTTDIGAFIYCPLKPSKCPAGGTEVAMRTAHLVQVLKPMKPHVARAPRRGVAP
jgi:hypothetical protein